MVLIAGGKGTTILRLNVKRNSGLQHWNDMLLIEHHVEPARMRLQFRLGVRSNI